MSEQSPEPPADQNTQAQGQQGDAGGQQTPPAPEPPKGQEPAPKTFTQAELDAIIADRVSREQRKFQQQLDQAQQAAGKTEAEKLTMERDQAKQEAAQVRTEAAKMVASSKAETAALAAGAKPDRVDAIVRNANLDDAVKDGEVDGDKVKAAIEKVLTDFPEWKAETVAGKSGGEMGGGTPTPSVKDFDAMTFEQKAELYQRDQQLYDRLQKQSEEQQLREIGVTTA